MDQADWRRGPGFDSGLSWLLDDLVTRVAEVDKAVMLSRDGLALAASAALTREDAEHRPEDVRSAVDLEEPIPVVMCDARQRGSSRDVLIALTEHSLRTLPPPDEPPPQNGREPQHTR
jgi:Roadblock/LC7 domain-containing protein